MSLLGQTLSVELRWDPNAEANLAGYNIYRSTVSKSGYYRLNSALITQTSFRDSALAAGHTYYYVCTAVNSVGLESGFSNEVSYRAPGPDPNPDENSPPYAANDLFSTTGNPPYIIDVLANDVDPDGDQLVVVETTQGTFGTVVINPNQTVTYTPGSGFQGEDTFWYEISDPLGSTSTAQVSLVRFSTPGDTGNRPPQTNPDGAITAGGVPVLINVVLNDSDPDGDPLTVVDVTSPSYGTTEVHDSATVLYSPPKEFEGTIIFEYVVTDGQIRAKGVVSVEVTDEEFPRRTIVFPTFIDTGNPLLENTYVGIGLLNPGNQSNSVALSAHDREGSEIVNLQLGETLRPSGQAAFMTSEVLSSYPNPVTVAVSGATGPLMGFFIVGDNDLGRLDGVGAELPAATELYVPIVRNTNTETTSLHVINRDEESAAILKVSLFKPDGSLVDEIVKELGALGSVLGTIPQIFGRDLKIEEGYLRVSSDVSVSAFAVVANEKSLTSFAARAGASSRLLVAPQFVVDSSGANSSVLRLLNTDDKTVRVRVRAFNDSSELLASEELFLSPRQLWAENLISIFEAPPDGLVTGYLEVEIQGVLGAASSIVSSITFRTFGGEAASTLPLQDQGWSEAVFPHVAQTSDGSIYTGFSLLNPGSRKAGVLVEAFDQDGRLTARRRLTLMPGTRAIDVLRSPTFFGNNFTQIKGHIRIESTGKLMIFAVFGDALGKFLSTIEGQKPPS